MVCWEYWVLEVEEKNHGSKFNRMNTIKSNIQKHWIAIVLLFCGLYASVFQITGFNLQRIAGDLGVYSQFIISIVEFNYQWLIGNYNSYWDGFFMYPDSEVISYSDNLLGSLPHLFNF